MIRLALDTSTRLASVALADGDDLLAESAFSAKSDHSATVLSVVERLLRSAGCGREALSSVVVGSGPGSFTGVRIAASLAKGLCFARGLPLFAFSSLRAVAAGCGSRDAVCALFDARRDEVYAAAYREPLASPATEIEPSVLPLDELLERIDAGAWSFAGEGALRHRERLERVGGRVLPEPFAHPRASVLLTLAAGCPDEGWIDDPTDWEPAYVRRSGAARSARFAG